MPKNFEKMSLEELLAWIDADNSDDAAAVKDQRNESPSSVSGMQYGKSINYTVSADNDVSKGQKRAVQNMQGQFRAQPEAKSEAVRKAQSEAQSGAMRKAQSEALSRLRSGSVNSKGSGIKLNFSQESLLQGILFSEILGKPRSKRRIRW